MAPDKAEAIRCTILNLHEVDDNEEADVLRDFLNTDPFETSAGLEGVSSTFSSAGDPLPLSVPEAGIPLHSPVAVEPGRCPSHAAPGLASVLADIGDQSLAAFLQQERAPTIAVLLASLPRQRAANVMRLLGRQQQWEVVRALANCGAARHEVMDEIGRELESWASQTRRTATQDVEDFDRVTQILADVDPAQKRQLLDDLAHHDPRLASRLGWPGAVETAEAGRSHRDNLGSPADRVTTGWERTSAEPASDLDAIGQLDALDLASALRALDPQSAALALAAADETILARLAPFLAPRQISWLRRRIKTQGPFTLAELHRAQRQLFDIAHGRARIPAVVAHCQEDL
jgi:hypothetical protein